ncbi:zinc finger protein 184-like isoform X2 [Toxorhynchites rutilus septentrionalis]|uniref:zinc finger protein 184-like isoform X2 n=1 Tax=Toxorhynchites rutilus septentrionalis TaxID=329112 RepID=UPI00247AA414|nr:zinc finger protein 184-like isoform X2 [Toxorhynchites rutilus septentrionalis]
MSCYPNGIKEKRSVELTCRICLTERDQYQPIFENGDRCIADWIQELTSLEIHKIPDAPASLCFECRSHLEAYESFRNTCIANDKLFKEIYLDNVPQDDSECGTAKIETILKFEDSETITGDDDQDEKYAVAPEQLQYDEGSVFNVECNQKIDFLSDQNANDKISDIRVVKPGHKDFNERNDGSPAKGRPKKLCTVCNKFVARLSRHQLIHENRKPFLCEFCSKGFNHMSNLREHTKTHTSEFVDSKKDDEKLMGNDNQEENYAEAPGQLQCDEDAFNGECNQKIDFSCDQKDGNPAKGRPKRLCTVCNKFVARGFNHMSNLKKHTKTHTSNFEDSEKDDEKITGDDDQGEKSPGQLQCDEDNKRNDGIPAKGRPKKLCTVCNKFVARLNRHQLIHKEIRLFQCEFCSKGFNHMSNFKEHTKTHIMKLIDSEKDDEMIMKDGDQEENYAVAPVQLQCDEDSALNSNCNQKIDFLGDQNAKGKTSDIRVVKPVHEDFNERNDSRPVLTKQRPKKLCTVCNKFVARLSRHRLIHKNIKLLQCEFCSKGFNHMGSLKKHIRTHTKEKPYLCNWCDKGFTTSTDLKVHVRSHTQEKPYGCDQCGKCFTTSGHLLRHTRSHHSGEKLYS